MGLLYSSTTFTVWTKRVYDWFDFKRTCILFHQSVFFYANHLGSNIMLAGDMNVIVGCVVPREEVDIRITQSWNIKDVSKVNCLFFCVLCRRTSRFMPNGFANVIEIGEQAINAHLFQYQCAYIFCDTNFISTHENTRYSWNFRYNYLKYMPEALRKKCRLTLKA